MGKYIIFVFSVLLLNTFPALSQEENSNKLRYRSFSISPLEIFMGNSSGLAISGDVSFDYDNNIFSLNLGSGTEGDFIGHNDSFSAINILYGRNFPLSKNFFTDVFVGAGYFHFNTYGLINAETRRKGEIEESTIGFPIGAKFQYMLGQRFSLGLKLGVNINSSQSIGTVGLVLQWNQRRD